MGLEGLWHQFDRSRGRLVARCFKWAMPRKVSSERHVKSKIH